MTKSKSLEKFQFLNKLLAERIELMKTLPQDDLFKSEEGRWNAMEILEHLYTAEQISLKYLRYKIGQGTKFKSVGFRQKYATWLMARAYLSNRPFIAPDGVKPTGSYKVLAKLETDYLDLRKEFYEFLKERPDSDYKLAMYKHPFFGRLSLHQMLVFFEGHAKRHGRQMDAELAKFT